jgi:hypothetical protein
MLFGQVEFDLAKASFFLPLLKLKFFLSKFFDKKNLLLPKFTHHVLSYRNWDEEILEQIQHHVTQNCP